MQVIDFQIEITSFCKRDSLISDQQNASEDHHVTMYLQSSLLHLNASSLNPIYLDMNHFVSLLLRHSRREAMRHGCYGRGLVSLSVHRKGFDGPSNGNDSTPPPG